MSFIFLIKLTSRHLIPLEMTMNENFFKCLYLLIHCFVHKNLVLYVDFAFLVYSFIAYKSLFLLLSLQYFLCIYYHISENTGIFIYLSTCISFIYCCLIAPAKISNTHCNKKDDNGYPYLFPDLRRKAFNYYRGCRFVILLY